MVFQYIICPSIICLSISKFNPYNAKSGYMLFRKQFRPRPVQHSKAQQVLYYLVLIFETLVYFHTCTSMSLLFFKKLNFFLKLCSFNGKTKFLTSMSRFYSHDSRTHSFWIVTLFSNFQSIKNFKSSEHHDHIWAFRLPVIF